MKNFVKRMIAFVHGIIAGALLYKFFTNSVLLNYVKKDFESKQVYRPNLYGTATNYNRTVTNYNKRMRQDFSIYDIDFKTRSDAEQVLKQIEMEIEKNGSCSVGKMKELINKETSWSDYHKGWTHLTYADQVVRGWNGKYYIDISDPVELD